MNRLIIIGNGFDLAHNLKTSYQHFIENYWLKVENLDYEDELISFEKFIGNEIKLGDSKSANEIKNKLTVGNNRYANLNYKSNFFGLINQSHGNYGWVDIEMLYYSRLKDFLKTTNSIQEKLGLIQQLNNEIESLTKIFEEYLVKNVKPYILQSKIPSFDTIFWTDKFHEYSDREVFKREFAEKNISLLLQHKFVDSECNKFEKTLILNFNFTNVIDNYKIPNSQIIKIHGELLNSENPILIGFGDESDSFYKELEDYDKNEFLKFIKSFYYLQSDEHKRAFDFLESDEYQVQIMGHSCALSDRTLLESLVNNKNCKSVKIFFHQNQDGKDNYTDIINSLSRHFPDKKRMRDIVVNKKYSTPLPQHWWF